MKTLSPELTSYILREWERPVAVEAQAAAAAIADLYRGACAGVLFYGSCLRTGVIENHILDFYVLVESYHSAYGNGIGAALLRAGNRLLPPNVFYHETEIEGVTVRSKYAVLSVADYIYRIGPDCLNVSVWARFCQPAVLLLAQSDAQKQRLAEATAQAICTMLGHGWPLTANHSSSILWPLAFEQTYQSELRSEKPGKGQEIYALDRARYDAVYPLALKVLEAQPHVRAARARRLWRMRRLNGKLESFLRLIKAAFTFQGGIDYLAWKISRHSGVAIDIKPWMRRIPIVAGLYLFVSLRLKGAFR